MANKTYFTATIHDIASWLAIYQSKNAFASLIQAIFEKEQLPYGPLKNLTSASNAIFGVGKDYVIKLFMPTETGYSNPLAAKIEKAGLTHANRVIPSPKLFASGIIYDKYNFSYLIMEQIAGIDFTAFSPAEKRPFVPTVKEFSHNLATFFPDPDIPILTKEECLSNPRWSVFPESFQAERKKIILTTHFDAPVFVHGDFKAANLLCTASNQLNVIDFADCYFAPKEYEWPYLIFGLFGCDTAMINTYFAKELDATFIQTLTSAFLMHKFGANLLGQIFDLKHIDLATITSLPALTAVLTECLAQETFLTE
ncbi:phosphotransferase [uncultured Enterococcus sp.]|uniref:phosphotransferase n=1 Tax=uncultured Enterococcus sp. TaxID=167972 RepID=UPI002804FCD0|nr:phosphotransferase [uncultured Enterococcus sp.]